MINHEELARLAATEHLNMWNNMNPGDCAYYSILIHNGFAMVSSVETGLAKVMTCEELINDHIAKALIVNINSPYWVDSWATGREYEGYKSVLKSRDDEYELEPIWAKLVTLLKIISTESKKGIKTERFYEIDVSFADDYIGVYDSSSDEDMKNWSDTLDDTQVEVEEYKEDYTAIQTAFYLLAKKGELANENNR